jgi:alpha-glucosidase
MLLLTMRGTPILYYGDELGMTEVAIPAERSRDGFARLDGGPSPDPNRTPMPWSAAAGAGFSPPGANEPWLPLGADWQERNVERQLAEPRSMLRLCRWLLALRRARASLRGGTIRVLATGSADCLLYERLRGTERSVVAINFSTEPRAITLPGPGAKVLVSTTLLDRDGPMPDGELLLGGHEGVVLEPLAGPNDPAQRAPG